MRFDLVDAILERSDSRIVTLKCVSAAEEYLEDHFPTFPVLPGVLMIEAVLQASRRLLSARDPAAARLVLAGARAVRFGAMVRPGESLRVEVELLKSLPGGLYDLKASGALLRPGDHAASSTDAPVAISGRFTLRPLLSAGAAPAA